MPMIVKRQRRRRDGKVPSRSWIQSLSKIKGKDGKSLWLFGENDVEEMVSW